MPDGPSLADLAARLTRALHLRAAPIGIAFLAEGETIAAPAFAGSAALPNRAGRTGSVPAGCLFWMKAQGGAFSTVAADHANCSVGSFTHGFITLAEAASTDDVAAVLEAGWVEPSAVESLPHVHTRPERIAYGALSTMPVDPDVVLVRIVGGGLMTLRDALPDLRSELPYTEGRCLMSRWCLMAAEVRWELPGLDACITDCTARGRATPRGPGLVGPNGDVFQRGSLRLSTGRSGQRAGPSCPGLASRRSARARDRARRETPVGSNAAAA